MWEMLRALAGLSQSKRDEVVGWAESVLKDKRRWTGAYDRIAWASRIVTNNAFESPPAGLFAKPPGMAESPEETDARVFLEERKGGKKPERITLGQPSIATNASGISTRYHMKFTETITGATSAPDLIDLVFSKGSVRHWAISCHGIVDHADGSTRILLGSGFDHSSVGLFTKLKGRLDVMWIGGCLAASSVLGHDDSKARAMNAECHLVAPAFLMTTGTGDLPMGRMDMDRRFMPVVFKPDGSLIAWDTFLRMGKTLNFMVS
jgi:hypothetical protein